jgi:hypothetical protein
MVRKSLIVIAGVIAIAVFVYAAEKAETKVSLPAAVESAVKAMFPKAVIEKSKAEKASIKAYEVELKDNGKTASMNVAADGTVAEVETTEAMAALPAEVAKTIKAQDANVTTVDKAVKYAELKLVKLDAPVTTYEAKITKDGKKMEVKIAADGKILKQEAVVKESKEKNEKGEHEGHETK